MWPRWSLRFIILALFVFPQNAWTQQAGNNSKNDGGIAARQAELSREQGSAALYPAIAAPIEALKTDDLRDSFNEVQHGHRHEAIDIMAPAGTPVHAADDGTIQKLFLSKAGGNTVYEFDDQSAYCYYYAHLERYADGLHEGMHVSRGQVIGYVGSTGDASPAAPHLHFAINRLGPERLWWKGEPANPYPILVRALSTPSRSSASRSSAAPIYLILEMLHAAG